jgi:hypothetical protein
MRAMDVMTTTEKSPFQSSRSAIRAARLCPAGSDLGAGTRKSTTPVAGAETPTERRTRQNPCRMSVEPGFHAQPPPAHRHRLPAVDR